MDSLSKMLNKSAGQRTDEPTAYLIKGKTNADTEPPIFALHMEFVFFKKEIYAHRLFKDHRGNWVAEWINTDTGQILNLLATPLHFTEDRIAHLTNQY